MFLGDEGPRLILADAFSDSWPQAAGAEAALEMLRDAATAGNELLGDLDRYTAARARPAPPAEVWVLEYSHKHGTDVTAYAMSRRRGRRSRRSPATSGRTPGPRHARRPGRPE